MNTPKDPNSPANDPQRLLRMALEGMQEQHVVRPAPPSAAELEAALPQFEVYGLIGQGGMGSVFRVRDKKLDRVVALKVLPRDLVSDPSFEERFLREARAQASLSHPNILTVYDFGETPGFFYIVAEFIDGSDLRQLMQMGQLSPAEALRIVPQICDALQFAHDHGIVHRDIKPENILLDQNGDVRVADFGLAKRSGDQDVSLTRSQQGLGTPHYMAPEQMTGAKAVDHRADIYALGVVIYEMLTAQLPIGHFAMPSAKSSARKELDDVVMRALAHAVEDRYQRVDEVKADLASASRAPETEAPKSSEMPARMPASAAAAPRLCKKPLVGLSLLFLCYLGLVAAKLFSAVSMEEQVRAEQEYQTYLEEAQVRELRGLVPLEILQPPMLDASMGAVPFVALGLISLILSILMMAFAFRGITDIKRSEGRLYGLGLAIFVAWIPAVLLVDGAIIAMISEISDRDVREIAMPIAALVLLGLDILFMRWQYRRHAPQ